MYAWLPLRFFAGYIWYHTANYPSSLANYPRRYCKPDLNYPRPRFELPSQVTIFSLFDYSNKRPCINEMLHPRWSSCHERWPMFVLTTETQPKWYKSIHFGPKRRLFFRHFCEGNSNYPRSLVHCDIVRCQWADLAKPSACSVVIGHQYLAPPPDVLNDNWSRQLLCYFNKQNIC